MSATIKTPFSNIQQELLQLYERHISDDDLMNIKELIGQYFAKRLTNLADNAWDRNQWTHQDMENILNDPNQQVPYEYSIRHERLTCIATKPLNISPIYQALQSKAYKWFVTNEILTEYEEQIGMRLGISRTDIEFPEVKVLKANEFLEIIKNL